MFKIEVTNLLGQLENHYWMNKSGDDFIQFLPKHFGVPKENINIFMMDDEEDDLLHAYLNSHEANEHVLSSSGKILIDRVDPPAFEEGQLVKPSDFDEANDRRAEMFVGTPEHGKKVPALPTRKEDFGNGPEDVVEIPVGHELAQEKRHTVKEFVGKPLKTMYPYSIDGVFLGHVT